MIRQWTQYELAADIIQKWYRSWRCYRKLRNCKSSFNESNVRQKKCKTAECLNNTLRGSDDTTEKLIVWRSCVELRRLHPSYQVDYIMKTLIDCRGDAHKASLMLGSSSGIGNSDAKLMDQLKFRFIPDMQSFSSDISSHDLTVSKLCDGSETLEKGFFATDGISRRQRKVNFIHSLRKQRGQDSKKELFDTLYDSLTTAYFTETIIKKS